MKLHEQIVQIENNYLFRLAQIQEKVELWIKQIAHENRLGLGSLDQLVEAYGDPYNSADDVQSSQENDTIEFTPIDQPLEKPKNQPISGSNEKMRLHLIYNPKSGQIESSIKTPMLSRPPAGYMEANAAQVHGALTHLESMNPKLADLLVAGRMSVWIPRAVANIGPSSVKHLGLDSKSSRNSNKLNMSDNDLARANLAASKMKLST